jgi:hypothetical protein
VERVQVHKIRKNEKDVSGGGKVQVHKIRKNEKRCFRRWKGFKFIKSEKMMRNDVSGGGKV